MQFKKMRGYIVAALLIGVVMITFSFTKADPPPGRCSHVVAWIDGGGEVGCLPFYTCSNHAWPLSTKCYVHMGTPDAPNPCN